MKQLILHPSEIAQWHALVNEAQSLCCLNLNEDLESYLVFLLQRYLSDPSVVESVFAVEFLNGQQASGNTQQTILRDVGDKCLLFSGLFPENAERRRVDLNYFIKMGQGAYHSLSHAEEYELATLYAELCEEFTSLMDVLQAFRDVTLEHEKLLDRGLWTTLDDTRDSAIAFIKKH